MVIVIVAIVFSVVKPLVSEKSGDVKSSYEKLQLMNALSVDDWYNNYDGTLSVIVSRDSTEGEFNGIEFTIESYGKSCYVQQLADLQILETETFIVGLEDCYGYDISSVSAIPILINLESASTINNIKFVSPTPEDGSSQLENSIPVSVFLNHNTLTEAFIDFDGSLVGWYTAQSGNAEDFSPYSNDGILNNVNVNVAGYFGKGFEFNSSENYIEVPNSSTIMMGPYSKTGRTISGWINPKENKNSYIFVQAGRGEYGEKFGYHLYLNNDSKLCFDTMSYGGFSSEMFSPPEYLCSLSSVNADEWTSYAISFYTNSFSLYPVSAGAYIKIYVNGEFESTNIEKTYIISSFGASNSPLLFGNSVDIDYDTNLKSFNGSMDEMMVFNRLLSSEEIISLYNATESMYHLFNNLDYGAHNFKSYSQDVSGNLSSTELRSIDVTGTYINGCQELNESGRIYLLNNDLDEAITPLNPSGVIDNCIKITADNIIFDCQGNSIKNPELQGTIIFSQADNVTIRNCEVMASSYKSGDNGLGHGISIAGNDNLVENNIITNTFWGIRIYGDYNLVQSNVLEGNAKAIHLSGGSNYNVVKENLLKNNDESQSWGLASWGGISNEFINNNVYGSRQAIVLYNAGNTLLKCGRYLDQVYVYANSNNVTAVNITYGAKLIGSGSVFTELSGDCSEYCTWIGDKCFSASNTCESCGFLGLGCTEETCFDLGNCAYIPSVWPWESDCKERGFVSRIINNNLVTLMFNTESISEGDVLMIAESSSNVAPSLFSIEPVYSSGNSWVWTFEKEPVEEDIIIDSEDFSSAVCYGVHGGVSSCSSVIPHIANAYDENWETLTDIYAAGPRSANIYENYSWNNYFENGVNLTSKYKFIGCGIVKSITYSCWDYKNSKWSEIYKDEAGQNMRCWTEVFEVSNPIPSGCFLENQSLAIKTYLYHSSGLASQQYENKLVVRGNDYEKEITYHILGSYNPKIDGKWAINNFSQEGKIITL